MVYQYLAYTEGGQIVKGSLAASSEDTAAEMLSYAGYRAISLKPGTRFISWEAIVNLFSHVNLSDISFFYRQLSILLESGVNVSASLEMLQAQFDNPALSKVLAQIIAEVRSGGQLSMAMSKFPKIFLPMHCRLLSIGEQSGNLEMILKQVADDMDKELAAVKETKYAMMYPVITFLVSIVVVGVLLTFVMPTFSNLYLSLDIDLPKITSIMINVSNLFSQNILAIIEIISSVALLGFLYFRTRRGRYQWDKLMLKIPYLGKIKHLLELSRCCRSLSVLFSSGLPLTEAVPMISQSCSNRVIAESFSELNKRMVKGEGLAIPMAGDKVFLPLMVQMVKVGEETGNLDNTLLTVSRTYSADAEYRLKTAISLVQPIMTIFIGLFVGLIALSMTSALYGIYKKGF